MKLVEWAIVYIDGTVQFVSAFNYRQAKAQATHGVAILKIRKLQ